MELRLAAACIVALTFPCFFFEGVQARPFFVIGSSYVDTGNVSPSDKGRPFPWRDPYGSTWPGLPAGRYSNGRVLTDFIASAMNLSMPTVFGQRLSWRKYDNGLNFAIGGSGVLSAYGYPSSSAQIDSLQSVVSGYNQTELASAFLLYVTAGEDYYYSLTVENTSLSNIYPLTVSVGKRIAEDLIRLYAMGLRNFAVTTLPPIGCFPIATGSNSFKSCNESWSTTVASVHNARVWKNLNGLKHYFKNSTLTVLDLYAAFRNAFSDTTFAGSASLVPCCAGFKPGNKCSSTDSSGNPMYTACKKPSSKFFWDDLYHPTEAGWQVVLKFLKSSLPSLPS